MANRPRINGRGSKQQIGPGVWRFRHSLGKNPETGIYEYTQWKTVYTTSKRELQNIMDAEKARVNAEYANPTDVLESIKPKSITVAIYADEFHDLRCNSMSPLAYKRERLEIDHIKNLFGGYNLLELKPNTIEKGYATARRNGLYSENELHKINVKFRQILEHAVDNEIIAKNPCAKIKIARPEPKERESLSLEDAQRLLKVLLSHKLDAHIVWVMLMLDTGMRRSEATGLPWKNVDLDEGTIYIAQQYASDKKVRPPKSKSGKRVVAISPLLIEFLRNWRKEQGRQLEELGFHQNDDTPVVHVTGKQKGDEFTTVHFADPNNFNRWFREFCVKNGFGKYEGYKTVRYVERLVEGKLVTKAYDEELWNALEAEMKKNPKLKSKQQIRLKNTVKTPYGYSGLTPHILRHTQATLLISENMDIKTVQNRLGHSSANVTLNIYSHAIAENDRKASTAFSNLLNPQRVD